jgi:hypothetical protein
MKQFVFILLFFLVTSGIRAQPVFKAGWNTYKTGTITHEYTYNFNNDTSKLLLVDSSVVLITMDSLVTMTIHSPFRDRSIYKTVNYFSEKKQILKTEEYKDENLTMLYEWRYDARNRKEYYFEDNKVTGNNFRKTYDYYNDKKTGDNIVTESSYYNGKIEFYTKTYYDKKNVKYKEVRLNDNNKDVVHIESFFYGDNGKLRERSVYFPEWKVTKRFTEKEGNMLPKCDKCLPVGTAEKISLSTKVAFIKRLLGRYKALLTDPGCDQFEYIFKNFTNCEIIVSTTNADNMKKVLFRYKEKVL